MCWRSFRAGPDLRWGVAVSAGDRELLGLAAKAAGIELAFSSEPETRPRRTDTWNVWNPLTDDGDAFRLAVALKLTVDFELEVVFGSDVRADDVLGRTTVDEPCIRRAIVRAAAEIGRSMP